MAIPKKRYYDPMERHYIELIMHRALQDRVSPGQYNAYGGTGIYPLMYKFELFPACAKFWVCPRDHNSTTPVTWVPRTDEDKKFLARMYYEYHTYRNR